MIQTINGVCFKTMIAYGARNLNKYCKTINRLNVFPVPDGDTGTNMVTTVVKGLRAIDDEVTDLSSVSKKLADAIIYGARGNSGVIMSQFIKGISETFIGYEEADTKLLSVALEHGVECAYSAVATPVEGTMLTVVKDASHHVSLAELEKMTVEEVLSLFVEQARLSLDRTPDLLPALKEAGVVDSGGAGVLYFFEGIMMYFNGQVPEELDMEDQEGQDVDYSLFNRQSTFEYGYCTEALIQLLDCKDTLEFDDFKKKLQSMGDSVVASLEKDKLRIHIHTRFPEQVFALCHSYGEFLNIKVENMTVQHTESAKAIMCSPNKSTENFSVVAVAYDRTVQKLFIDMGADVVIYSPDSASTKDYIDAFEQITTENILVFPNSSDSVLTAIQAKKLYEKATVTVINSRSIAQCYASLPLIDYSESIKTVTDTVNDTITNMYVISVLQRKTPSGRSEYLSFSGKQVITVNSTIESTVIQTVEKTIKKYSMDIVTIFYSDSCEGSIDDITNSINDAGLPVEVYSVPCHSMTPYELLISFE